MLDELHELYDKKVVVLGCGNVLFGDDGFGPAVVEHLRKNYEIPPHVGVMDVGTSVRDILLDIILTEKRAERIIVVDGLNIGKNPGEIFVITPKQIPENIGDFSLHQVPTSNLLRELESECHVEVIIVACQIENMPDLASIGLSKRLIDAIPKVCDEIVRLCTN